MSEPPQCQRSSRSGLRVAILVLVLVFTLVFTLMGRAPGVTAAVPATVPAVAGGVGTGDVATAPLSALADVPTAGSGRAAAPPDGATPEEHPDRGLHYGDLVADPACGVAYRTASTGRCTHGPDPGTPGVDVRAAGAPEPAALAAVSESAVACDGDGTSGNRVEVLYARPSTTPDRFATYLPSFRQWAADTDAIYAASAAETGGVRRVRYVTDAGCAAVVTPVVLSASGLASLDTMIAELRGLGYDRTDRKYLVFADASVYCGIATLRVDDQPGQGNRNNSGPSYARVDAACWGGAVAAHETMHTMGGVQLSAPHTSGGGHCTDEWDRMCYSDAPNYPAMVTACPASAHDQRFDCNHDDYFSTAPPAGSYLATHWNSADNRFLIAGGAVPTPTPGPVSPTFTLAAAASGPGAVAGAGDYAAGAVATLTATAAPGAVFLGWNLDEAAVGWPATLTVTMQRAHTAVAVFMTPPGFSDAPFDLGVGGGAPGPIAQLAARGVIRGYGDGRVGPNDPVLRAQMAALVVRASGWEGEAAPTPFTDRGTVDDQLWSAVGILAQHGVARGYGDGRFGPLDPVLRVQVVSFVTRAMVARGRWQQRPDDPSLYPNVLASTGHRSDLATYVFYAGDLPGAPRSGPLGDFDQPATRLWFAQVLWRALNVDGAVDRVP